MIEVNEYALSYASLGVRRYARDVIGALSGYVTLARSAKTGSPRLNKALGLLHVPQGGATLWTPTPTGSLRAEGQIVTVHDCIGMMYGQHRSDRRSLYMRLSTRIYQRCRCIVFISHDAQRQFAQFYSLPDVPQRVIASGLPTQSSLVQAARALEPRGPTAEPPYILTVGNALPHKNIGALCEAYLASRLPAEGVLLKIVGPLDPTAQAALAARPDAIKAMPRQSDPDLARLLARARAFVSPSLVEGHNLTIAEALMIGVPVLASDIPAHREFYDGRCGFFDPEAQDAMVAGLETLLDARSVSPGPDDLAKTRTLSDTAADYAALFRELGLA